MSRTDQHDPWLVRLQEPGTARAVHRHTADQPCDLPPLIEAIKNGSPWSASGCYWWPATGFWYENPSCGCRLCTRYYERKWARRRERYAARQQIREQLLDMDDDGA